MHPGKHCVKDWVGQFLHHSWKLLCHGDMEKNLTCYIGCISSYTWIFLQITRGECGSNGASLLAPTTKQQTTTTTTATTRAPTTASTTTSNSLIAGAINLRKVQTGRKSYKNLRGKSSKREYAYSCSHLCVNAHANSWKPWSAVVSELPRIRTNNLSMPPSNGHTNFFAAWWNYQHTVFWKFHPSIHNIVSMCDATIMKKLILSFLFECLYRHYIGPTLETSTVD